MREEGEYAPDCKTCPIIERHRKNGDEYRIDLRISDHEKNEDRIIWPMREFRYGNVDLENYQWEITTALFYDKTRGEFMEWDAWDDNQGMGISLSSNQERSESYNWQGFFIEESIAVALVGNMLDNKLAKAAVSVLASQEDFSAKSLIKKLQISGKKVVSIINGTHALMKVDAREIGGNSDFVLLNFTYRDQLSKPFLSLVCDRSDILKQYIAILKNPMTDAVQTCSLRDYRDDGSLRFYAYCEAITPESTHFEVSSYLTGLHHTRPGPGVFKFEVPEGWKWADQTDPEKAILYDENGEIAEVYVYKNKKQKSKRG